MVLFGATGDLSRRKLLPGLLHLYEAELLRDCRIVGTSLDDLDTEQFVKLAREAIDEFSRPFDESCWDDFSQRLSFVRQSDGPEALAAAVEEAERQLAAETDSDQPVQRLHYLSVPPKAALPVVHQLADAGLVERSRIIMEKPFGTDLASAQKLNSRLHEVFAEEQIFRIDHFLGKEAAQNILAFRFANGLFEPIWNRNFIDHVQIDVPETLGLEMRASFYESTGAFRDMVVTHLMQVLAFMAMEPPTSLAPDPISDEKLKVFRSMRPLEPHNVVRGQYAGYRDLDEVADDSDTETFVALKVEIDNWRWAGVPFFLRTGKRLPITQTEVRVVFRRTPQLLFHASANRPPEPNQLVVRLDPTTGVRLLVEAQRGEHVEPEQINLDMEFGQEGGEGPAPYEVLLHAAMRGDSTRFTRQDGVEEAWRVMQPLLDAPPPVHPYEPGTWGPPEADKVVAGYGRWHEPWSTS